MMDEFGHALEKESGSKHRAGVIGVHEMLGWVVKMLDNDVYSLNESAGDHHD